MAWNKSSNEGNKPEGPPDLEEAIRNFQKKIQSMLGGGKNPSGVELEHPFQSRKPHVGLVIGIVALIYILSGIYVVDQPERAVITRFGRYVRTVGPGPHWIPRFIESKKIVNVEEVLNVTHSGQMLTKDENIVIAEIAVQFRRSEPRDYLFNIVDPELTLKQVAESALRQAVGQTTLDDILTKGRASVVAEARKLIEMSLQNYRCGLEISDLALQQTKAPEEVKAAFDDAIKAQQDEDRLVNEAQAYSRRIIPIAEGKSKRIHEDANAYREKVILLAKGETARFSKILPEYQRAPEVTRQRMYMDTLEKVYTGSNKLVVDVEGANNMLYLPIDKLINNGGAAQTNPAATTTPVMTQSDESTGALPSAANPPTTVDAETSKTTRSTRPSYRDSGRPTRPGGA